MNRVESTIFLCGVGILALAGCTQPEPITDDSIYVGGKIGTITVDTPTWNGTLECEYRKGRYYKPGHEILCDETPKPVELKRYTLKDWWEDTSDWMDPEPDHKPDNKPSKDDNSDANGKGGNHHDRTDKDSEPQEIAENKKEQKHARR